MRIEHEIVADVYKKKAKDFGEGKSKVEYWRVILDIDDEVDELACTQEAYEKIVIGKKNRLRTQYDTKQDKYKVIDFLGVVDSVPPKANNNK